MCNLCRRHFIRGAAAFGAASLFATPRLARAQSVAAGLPARGEFVIRNGHVMTMDNALGDIAGGVVHVRDGEIIAVGREVSAPGAQVIDATDMIVLPGLIETHWHMWNTLFRSFSGDEQAHGYFPTVARYGALMTPDDMYQGARLSAAEAINSDMTTVHDWCHNIRSREYAERDIQALKDTGVRARFSYGWAQGQDDNEMLKIADIEALHRDWKNHSNGGLITLGLGWRGMFRAGPLPENVYRTEAEAARRMGDPPHRSHPEQSQSKPW
jgi:5-methylthioadenosine/S-adenosylhomocysteine deaminase